jgi:hypothetical protein
MLDINKVLIQIIVNKFYIKTFMYIIMKSAIVVPEHADLMPSEDGQLTKNIYKLYDTGRYQQLRSAIFWDVVPCRSCVNRRFRGTYRLHLEGRKNLHARNQPEQVAAV